MKAFKTVVFILVCMYAPFKSLAWGMEGHRIVGQIAESYLTPKAKAAIQKILGNESIALASNWADFVRSDTAYKSYDQWHYLNIKDSISYDSLQAYFKQDTATDVYTKLNLAIKELGNKNLPADKKLFYLRFLIHLVGDIHQPMHVGHPEDRGGNGIKVMWFNERSNLHQIWDEKLVEYQQLSYTEYTKAINFTTAKQLQQWQKDPISLWVFESYQVTGQLYAELTQQDQKLSYRYNFDHVAQLNDRLLKGGVRLAGILNQLFGK